jgi:cell division inhibitor SulA
LEYTPNKEFDCIAMKNAIQEKIYMETKDMSFQELRAYLDKTLQNDAFWQRIVSPQRR